MNDSEARMEQVFASVSVVVDKVRERSHQELPRHAAIAVTATLLVVAVVLAWYGFAANGWGSLVGVDRATYVEGAQRWLAGGGFYLERQLQGPYEIRMGDLLYPPTALWIFVPLSFLPAALWWAIPVGFIVWSVWEWRPAIWAWPLIALFVAWPNTTVGLVTGYPGLWVGATVAAALRWGWPGALVLLKPSLLPFAVIGVRTRGWWLVTGLLVLATLPLLAMLPDWIRAVLDGRGWGGWLYSLREVPLMLLPIVAWAGRTRLRTPQGHRVVVAREVGQDGGR